MAVERRSRKVYREVGIPQVLRHTSRMNTAHENRTRRNTTYMVYRAPSAMPPYEGYSCLACRADVDLLPRVLVPAYDDARVIAV